MTDKDEDTVSLEIPLVTSAGFQFRMLSNVMNKGLICVLFILFGGRVWIYDNHATVVNGASYTVYVSGSTYMPLRGWTHSLTHFLTGLSQTVGDYWSLVILS
ncbi:hypothetical protein SAY86_027860 [Trapa natans]|uniref:Uncharacterized protein n=1 Tax=Trapa natans TaxID=22666 RepID=A0AAN7LZS5_TRANT|nr:hypothetical protein SAY86_027860 [Trapa natans]